MGARKRQRRVSGVAPQPNANAAKLTQSNSLIPIIFGVSGWLAALLVGILELPTRINSFYGEKDEALANLSPRFDKKSYLGQWTDDPAQKPNTALISEDGTSAVKDAGRLQLDIADVGDGEFGGEIVSKQILKGTHPYTRIFLSGRIALTGGFEGEVWDIIQNERKTLAKFTLTPLSRDILEFKSDKQFDQIVPASAILWPSRGAMSDGEMNPNFTNLLRSVIDTDAQKGQKE